MKITLDIDAALLREARRLARRDGVRLDALIERGLRHAIADRSEPQRFRLKDASVAGQGLNSRWKTKTWQAIRRASYVRAWR